MARRALIVEDNELNLKLFSEILKLEELEVTAARDGEEAIEALSADPPDVLVIDLQLPKHSGLWVLRQFRACEAEGQRVPAIGVSAFTRAEDRDAALEAGCDVFLAKPVAPNELVAALNAVLKPSSDKG